MLKNIVIVLMFLLASAQLSFAEESASKVERSNEVIQQEEALRAKVNAESKSYIKEIVFNDTDVGQEIIDQIKSTYEGRWVSKDDIMTILNLAQPENQPDKDLTYAIHEEKLIIKKEGLNK